jgi:hypothetical protein
MSQANQSPSSRDGRPWVVASKLLLALANSELGVGNKLQFNRYLQISRACRDLAFGRDVLMEHDVFKLICDYRKQAVLAYADDPDCFDTAPLPD